MRFPSHHHLEFDHLTLFGNKTPFRYRYLFSTWNRCFLLCLSLKFKIRLVWKGKNHDHSKKNQIPIVRYVRVRKQLKKAARVVRSATHAEFVVNGFQLIMEGNIQPSGFPTWTVYPSENWEMSMDSLGNRFFWESGPRSNNSRKIPLWPKSSAIPIASAGFSSWTASM